MKKFKWSYLYLGIVFLFLYAPIFYLIFYSFNEGDDEQLYRIYLGKL